HVLMGRERCVLEVGAWCDVSVCRGASNARTENPEPRTAMHGRGPAPEHTHDPFADGLPALEGDRVRLRQADPRDVPDLLDLFGDADTLAYWSHGPLADHGAAETYYQGMQTGLRDRSLFQWAVTEPADDRLIGTVTLVGWDKQNRRCELGFILHPNAQGRGLASDAVRTALRFAFSEMGLARVEADVDPDNAASSRLLARLGFVLEGVMRRRWFTFGTWKDSYFYGLLESDFESDDPGT
ncbi:GNAT family N-acetyltransferase, partial [Rubrivirga sp.]|uniref:GNAT family N-acetyltransferase n=1 Tax=Rubrivirga sp. TaxID=1885344 RepID=UPI003C775E64